ncbi:MAG TPA: hypothetical protein PK020_11925 [Ilumatobacteraceae bacterium]|nr:hypothetical protein [Ilumatobacteraceae bacterium]
MIIVQELAGVVGLVLVVGTLASALKTIVVPRGYASWLTRIHFTAWRQVFGWFSGPRQPYATRDRVLAHYAPVALVTLPAAWVALVCIGFTGVFWAAGIHPLAEAFATSGSSLFTLGFDRPAGTGQVILSFVEAGIGLGLVSLMISYLPTIYGAFSRREALVGLLEVRAGLPPSPAVLLTRYARINLLDRMDDDLFVRWEEWFMDVEESHTSQPSLVFFRSPHPDRSWVTAAGCVLDTAALRASTIDVARTAQTDLVLRSGFFALRRIADYFGIAYDPDPQPDAAISITRPEFDQLVEELRVEGIPLKSDMDQAWRDYSGWRVNYDTVLIELCGLVMAPPARWSSDRPQVDNRFPKVFHAPRRRVNP